MREGSKGGGRAYLPETELQSLADRLLLKGRRAARVLERERVIELESGEAIELDEDVWQALTGFAERIGADLLRTYRVLLQHALLDPETRAEFLREILDREVDQGKASEAL